MIIHPYRRVRPAPVPVALLDADARAWNATGEEVDVRAAHPHALYVHADVARRHLTSGWGRGRWWNAQLISWSPWPNIHVRVLPDSGAPKSFGDRLAGVTVWAEWLAFNGVTLAAKDRNSAPASIGSASRRLLRARLAAPLWCGYGQRPPIRAVIGGRQEMGWNAPGTYSGPFYLWDMSAAYARTLAGLPYGGWWRHLPRHIARDMPLDGPNPAFVRARVTMPGGNNDRGSSVRGRPLRGSADGRGRRLLHSDDGPLRGGPRPGVPDEGNPHLDDQGPAGFVGPLPERPRGHRTYTDSLLMPTHYPRTGTVQGTWSAPEVRAALAVGCEVRILEAWRHYVDSDARPFGPWWVTVAEGRALGGYAGDLGKAMGNALLGQFHIDRGRHQERWWEGGRVHRRVVRHRGVTFTDLPLSEYVTGSVRARLYAEAIAPGGEHVLCAHTDGAWIRGKEWRPGGGQETTARDQRQEQRGPVLDHPEGTGGPGPWRLSDAAEVIDLIDPQHFAYRRPGEAMTRYKMAGSEARDQAHDFDERWSAVVGPDVQRQTTAFDHVAEIERATRKRKVRA